MFAVRARRAASAASRALAVNGYRALVALGVVSTTIWATGCYTYVSRPASEIVPRDVVAADINDVGRVALADRIGTEVARIEGEVVQQSDSGLRLMVSEVRSLNGITNPWQGQEVTLHQQDWKSLTQRTFSRSRTTLAIAVIGGLIGLAIFNKSIRGIFSGDPNRDKGGEPPPAS